MAKKPTYYPYLRRDRTKRSVRRVDAIFSSELLEIPKVIKASRLFKPSGLNNPTWLNTTSKYSYSQIRSGVKNPGWRVTIAKGGDASSNYSRTKYAIKPTHYTIVSEDVNYYSQGYGTVTGATLVQENDTTVIDSMAIARLRNRLQGKVGNAQLAAPIAEGREIGRLVRQINGLGMSTLKAMLAAKKTKGKSAAKQLGDAWLGFGFGVNPLLKDIQSSADAILHYITRNDSRIVIRGTADQVYHSGLKHTSSSEFVSAHCSIAHQSRAEHKQSIRYTAGIDLKVRAGGNYGVTDHLGLKISDLPSTLWELTAFSWVADYFGTVGDWLEDTFYTVPGNVIYVNKSYKYQCDTVGMPVVFTTAGAQASLSGSPFVLRYTRFTRTKYAPVLPVRPLRIKTLDEVAVSGTTKLLNLASVLIGRSPSSHWGPKLLPKKYRTYTE
jgi:hypothetical protein